MPTRPGYIWSGTEWIEIGQSAVVAPVAYQASAPSTPATGDIWIDSDDEVPSVDSTLYYRWTKTMSGGETSLSGTDNNSLSLQYTPGYESVFINGVLQARNLDYTATSGSTISGLTALASNDIVMVESIVAYSVGDTYTQSTLNSMFSPITTTGLVLISSTDFSAVASMSINNAFSSTYQNYKVLIYADPSADVNIDFRFRASGTDNSNSNYRYFMPNAAYDGSGVTNLNGLGTTFIRIGSSSTGNQPSTFSMDLFNPQELKNTYLIYSHAGEARSGSGGGTFNTTTQFDGFSVFPTSGTFTGTIKVYGYK